MTEFKCGSCKEVLILSPKARFCPECGSSSLNLIIKELTEPAQKETLGVYSPRGEPIAPMGLFSPVIPSTDATDAGTAEAVKEEEDQPRRRRR